MYSMANPQQKPEENGKGRKVVRIIQQPFPQPLEERFSAILSCVNSEWKAITLAGILNPHEPKGKGRMRNDFRRLVGEESYVPDAGSFKEYANWTFVPIGLVACKVVMSVGSMPIEINRWCLTNAGETYGAFIAAFSLNWAVKHSRSVYEILGTTNSTGESRAPYNRAMLLMKLTENRTAFSRVTDLEASLSLDDHGVLQHLLALKRIGFLDYTSVNPESRGWAKYTWIKSKDPEKAKKNENIGCRHPTLKGRIIDLMSSSRGPVDYKEIATALSYKNLATISTILSDLNKCSYAVCKWQGRIRSDISITDAGSEFVETYVKPIRNALVNGPALGKMQKLRISEFAGAAASLYYPHSLGYKKRSGEIRLLEVLKFVRDHQTGRGIGPRFTEILRGTEQKSAKQIYHSIAEGLLERQRKGNESHYILTEKGRKRIL